MASKHCSVCQGPHVVGSHKSKKAKGSRHVVEMYEVKRIDPGPYPVRSVVFQSRKKAEEFAAANDGYVTPILVDRDTGRRA